MCKLAILDKLKGLFIYEQPSLFAHYSPISSITLLIIRIISTLYLTGFYIYDFSDSETLLNRFIYLTNVGYFLTWLYFVVSIQARILKICKGLDFAAQILFQVAFCVEVFITIAYWSVIYMQSKQPVDFNNVNWHGVPIFFLILDFIFNSYRFIPSQYWAYVVLVFVYMIGCNLPYSIGVTPVYGSASDWVGWMTYALIAAGFIVGALSFLLGWLVYRKCKQHKVLAENTKSQNQVAQNAPAQLVNSQNKISQINNSENRV